MGGMMLGAASSVGVWRSAASTEGGVQTSTVVVAVSWGKTDVTVGCRTVRATRDMVSREF